MKKRNSNALDDLWKTISLGVAKEKEKIDAAALAGKSEDNYYVPGLLLLLEDHAGQVRYYALQSLVLDLQQKDEAMQARCWKFLRADTDEDVRAMAASCLGSLYFGTKSRHIFCQLVKELKNSEQPLAVKAPLYRALFKVAGMPPLRWPGNIPPWKAFKESAIDWDKIAWLEDQMESP